MRVMYDALANTAFKMLKESNARHGLMVEVEEKQYPHDKEVTESNIWRPRESGRRTLEWTSQSLFQWVIDMNLCIKTTY